MARNKYPMFDRLEKDKLSNKWFESFNKINTKLSYRNGLRCFCEFTGMMPEDLIKEAREDYIKRVPPWELRHIKRIEDFLTSLKKGKELANYTKANYIKALKHFYTFNKIPVDLKCEITQRATEKYLDIPVQKIEDIRKAVISTGTNLFLKAFILSTLSSGQAQAEIRALKGKHLKNVINGVAVVNMTRGKTNRRYFFMLSQEALEAIKEYKPHLKDDDFVFTKAKSNQQLTPQAVTTAFSRHAKKLGFSAGYFAPHRGRHYFKTALTGYMNDTYIEYLMGHKLPGVESSYFLGKNQDKIIVEYIKNQHLLTVFTDKEILQKQYDDLKIKHESGLSNLTEENKELKRRLVKLEQFVLQDAGKQS